MIVKYNRNSIMGVAHTDDGGKTNHEHTLLPGYQEVDTAKWNVLKKHPTVKLLIEDGTVEEMDKMGDDVVKGFAKAKSPEAIKMVGETIDMNLLKSWQASSDKRPGVKKAIDDRIAEIQGPIEHRSDDGHPITQEERVRTAPANLNP